MSATLVWPRVPERPGPAVSLLCSNLPSCFDFRSERPKAMHAVLPRRVRCGLPALGAQVVQRGGCESVVLRAPQAWLGQGSGLPQSWRVDRPSETVTVEGAQYLVYIRSIGLGIEEQSNSSAPMSGT